MDQSFQLGVAEFGEEPQNAVDEWDRVMAFAYHRAEDDLFEVYHQQDHPAVLVLASLDQHGHFEVLSGISPLLAADESSRSARQCDSEKVSTARE